MQNIVVILFGSHSSIVCAPVQRTMGKFVHGCMKELESKQTNKKALYDTFWSANWLPDLLQWHLQRLTTATMTLISHFARINVKQQSALITLAFIFMVHELYLRRTWKWNIHSVRIVFDLFLKVFSTQISYCLHTHSHKQI